jgi:Fic family protein
MSNATAERYLNDLEKEGKITQHGKIGQSVFYTLK